MHASAVKLFFTDVAERQIKAFSERCIKLYKEGKLKADVEPATITAAKVTPRPATAVLVPLPTAAPAAAAVAPPLPPSPSAAPTQSPFHYPHRAAALSSTGSAATGVSPDLLVSNATSPLLACPVLHLGPRIKFSATEVEKLRVVFLKHAKPAAKAMERNQQESKATPGVVSVPEHLYAPSGSELRLDVEGFAGLCTDVCMATGGVFGKFRERATVRTISDVGASGMLTHALFVGDPQLYATSCNLSTGIAQVPEIEDPEATVRLQPSGDGSVKAASATSLVPHTYSFGDFLAHFYYCTTATIEEKLLYVLLLSARRLKLYGQEGYDPSQNRGGSPIPPDLFSASSATASLSIPSLRSATAAFFCEHVGVLRHIMPLMSYHRARELREQIESHRRAIAQKREEQANSPNAQLLPPVAAAVSAPVEPGVTVLALLGLLEGVLSEAETAVSEAIEQMSDEIEQQQEEQLALRELPPAAAVSTAASAASPSLPNVPVEHWVSLWSKQAELLALVSVPGLATLIQINSMVPLEALNNSTDNRSNSSSNNNRNSKHR